MRVCQFFKVVNLAVLGALLFAVGPLYGQTVTATVPVGVNPDAIAVNPRTNKIYVGNFYGTNGITVIDGKTNTTKTLTTITGQVAVAVNPLTNMIYFVDGYNYLTVVDGSNDTVAASVLVGGDPVAVTVNPTTNLIYVAYDTGSSVDVIDGTNNMVKASLGLAGGPNHLQGFNPISIYVNPVTNKIYVTCQSADILIDGATNAVTQLAYTGGLINAGPVGVNPVTNTIYAVIGGNSTVQVVDETTGTLTTTIASNLIAPFDVALNTVTNKIYVLNTIGDVTVIDGATNATTKVTDANAQGPIAVTVNPMTNQIYVANSTSGNVTVIDGATNATTTLTAGMGPSAIAENPVTNTIYVANYYSNNVTVIGGGGTMQSIPLDTTITPLTGNQTSSATPTFTFTASSTFAPIAPPVNAVYFQVDSLQGPWTQATSKGGGSYSGTTSTLSNGSHTIYAFATDGQDATATITGVQTSSLIGSIANYAFTVASTGPAPGFSPSAATVAFGNETEGVKSAAMSVTITNTGSANLTFTGVALSGTNAADFAISADTCNAANVAASATCSVSVTFKPSTAGAESASIQFTDNATGSPQSVALTGTGVAPAPVLSPNPLSVGFGNQPQTVKSAVMSVTVTNTGNANLTFSAEAISGTNAADFAISSNTCNTASVAPNATCSVGLTFTPSILGAESASLKFTDNAANSPQSLALTGTGTPSAPVFTPSPSSLPFGSQPQGAKTSAMTVTVTNTGNANLTFTAVAVSGTNAADFAISADTCNSASVAPNATCTVSVTFTPSTIGGESASLKFTDNAANSPQSISMTGTGVAAAPVVSLSPTSLAFTTQAVGTSSTAQGVTLTNTGNVTLTISGITVTGANSGDFSEADNCNGSVAASAKCTINITFKPTATGTRSGSVSIADNAAGSPQTVGLTGTASDFSVDLASGGSSTATVTAGQPATYSLQITPAGGFSGTVNISCSGAPSEATCAPSSPSATISGNSPATFMVNVTTTAPSMVLPFGEPRDGRPFDRLRFGFPLTIVLLAFVVWALSRGAGDRRSGRFAYASVLGFLLLAGAFLAGCNSSSHHDPGTPQGSYTLTITATANGDSHTKTVNLTVN